MNKKKFLFIVNVNSNFVSHRLAIVLAALDNLVNFIIHCLDHPKAANETFLISDGEDVSTTELLQRVAKVYDKKSRQLPVPVSLMKFAAKLIGKADVADRLFGSLLLPPEHYRSYLPKNYHR